MDTQRWSSPENPPPLAVLAASTRGIFRTGIGSDKKLAWASTLAFPFKKLRRLMFSTGSYPSVCNHCVPRCPPSRSGLRCCSYAGLLARMMLASLGFLGWFFLSFFSPRIHGFRLYLTCYVLLAALFAAGYFAVNGSRFLRLTIVDLIFVLLLVILALAG